MGQATAEKSMKRFSESHEWVEIDGDVATVGVSDYAQKELGDIVFVELPDIGSEVSSGNEIVVLESTKAAADVYSPLSGEVIAVNEALEEASGLVNDSAEGEGWLFKLKVSDASEAEALMDQAKYEDFVG